MALSDHPSIAPATKRRVRQLSRMLGYRRPSDVRSRPAATRTPLRLGFLLLGGPLREEVNLGILEALTRAAHEADARFETAAIDPDGRGDAQLDQVRSFVRDLDGLVVSGLVDREHLALLEQLHLPYVVLGHTLQQPHEASDRPVQIVAFDELAAGRLATARLAACGHQRIAFISQVLHPGLNNDRWLLGYRLGLLEAQLPVEPQLIQSIGPQHPDVASIADALLSISAPPTAWVVADATTAARWIDALRKRAHALPREALIFGCASGLAQQHGLEEYPRIEVDSNLLVRTAVQRLVYIREHPPTGPIQTVVGFETINLPPAP